MGKKCLVLKFRFGLDTLEISFLAWYSWNFVSGLIPKAFYIPFPLDPRDAVRIVWCWFRNEITILNYSKISELRVFVFCIQNYKLLVFTLNSITFWLQHADSISNQNQDFSGKYNLYFGCPASYGDTLLVTGGVGRAGVLKALNRQGEKI